MHTHTCINTCIPTYEFNNNETGYQLESGAVMRRPRGRVAGRKGEESDLILLQLAHFLKE